METVLQTLPVFTWLGVLVAFLQLRKFLGFIWFHFLRPTGGYKTYLQGPSPYAVITGATDGIGKAVALNLYLKGFNVILHGRNEGKMSKVVEELKASRPKGDIKTFIADGNRPDIDFKAIAQKFNQLNITILVNNAGGTTPRPLTIDGWEEEEQLDLIRRNAIFPTLLTRAFLPQLRKTSRERPVLVTFSGSLAGNLPIPRTPMYSSSKAFLRRLSQSLNVDERFDGPSNISFMYHEIGEVVTNSVTLPPALLRPTSEEYARKVVDSFGCGRQIVFPYVWHHVARHSVDCLPEWMKGKIYADEMRVVLDMEKTKEKKS